MSTDRRVTDVCRILDRLREVLTQKEIAGALGVPETTLGLWKSQKPPQSPSERILEAILDGLLKKTEWHGHLDAELAEVLEREKVFQKLRRLRNNPTSFERWIGEAVKLAESNDALEGGGIGAASGALFGTFFGPLGMIAGALIAGTAGAFIGAPSPERKKKLLEIDELYRQGTLECVDELAASMRRLLESQEKLNKKKCELWEKIEHELDVLGVGKQQIRQFEDEFNKNFPTIESVTGISEIKLLGESIESVSRQISGKQGEVVPD